MLKERFDNITAIPRRCRDDLCPLLISSETKMIWLSSRGANHLNRGRQPAAGFFSETLAYVTLAVGVGWVIGAGGARFNVQSVGCYDLRDCDVGHRCFGSLLRACEAADWGSMGRDGI